MGTDTSTRGGLLSPDQRRYLRGESDIEIGEKSTHERAIRARIREGVKNGLADFTLLRGLGDKDLQQIYDSRIEWQAALEFILRPRIREIIETRSLAEVATDSTDESAPGVWRARTAGRTTSETYEKFLGLVLESALDGALSAEDPEGEYAATVDVKIEKRADAADLEAQLQTGAIEPEDIQEHYRAGLLDAEALHQLTRGLKLLRDPNDERRRELLNQSIPMLEDDAE